MTTATVKTPEQIEQEMIQTRESITEKVTSLENQVVGTVRTAADTLTDTVDAVKSLVTEAPEAVRQAASAVTEKLKDTFNVSGHVLLHPWATVTGAVGLGCLVGWFTSRSHAVSQTIDKNIKNAVDRPTPPPTPPSEHKPGMVDEMMAMMGDKVRDLARTALDSVSTALNELIREEIPHLITKT